MRREERRQPKRELDEVTLRPFGKGTFVAGDVYRFRASRTASEEAANLPPAVKIEV